MDLLKNSIMKNLFLLTLLIFGSIKGFSQKVYDATIDTTAQVHIVFLEVQDSTQADIWVYVVDSASQVYKEGHWYYTENSLESLFNFALTGDPPLADLKVYFVSNPTNAGWRDSSKRYLYLYARRRHF